MTYSALLTDQYQLMMAYCYWKMGLAEREAVFHLSLRKLPQGWDYLITAGLQNVIDFLSSFHLSNKDILYLTSLEDEGERCFPPEFLQYLSKLHFSCSLDAIPEGRLCFAKEPILRIQGPILQCQLLETPLLNFINFSTLIASKASQVCQAARGDKVMEFGLRRAQGPDGGITATRSSYIGGCNSTSNTLAGKLYGIPIQGTQAHSWIMAYPSELAAFQDFADVMGNKTVLLVDTYKTITGIAHAIEVGHHLKKRGEYLAGIRLDSGDLLQLSKMARQMLDEAGLTETKIIASGDLDVEVIAELKENQAPIDSWGVGTRLVTSYTQPALNAIYKLSAIKNEDNNWLYKMKISDDAKKMTLPGILQVARKDYQQDTICMLEEVLPEGSQALLQPIFRQGKLIYQSPSIHEIRKQSLEEVGNFVQSAAKPYPILMSKSLERLVADLTGSYDAKI